MKFISIVLVAGLFLGCTVEKNHEPKKNNVLNLKKEAQIEDVVVEDLINIPQDIAYYTKAIETKKLYDVQKKYEESYFSVWNIAKPTQSLENTQWAFKYFHASKSYGENLVPLKQDFFDAMYKKSNFGKYATVNKKALTLQY